MVAFDMVSRRPRWVVPIQSFATLRGVGWVGVCTAMCMYRTGSSTKLYNHNQALFYYSSRISGDERLRTTVKCYEGCGGSCRPVEARMEARGCGCSSNVKPWRLACVEAVKARVERL